MKTYNILIADDYTENLQIIVDALQGSAMPHRIIKAINGRILCELAEKRLPDLIITDWEMPEMDGIEAIKYLKSLETTKDIPIIMCTGIMTTSGNLKLALDSGAVDFIRKPIDKLELQARVYSMLQLADSYRTIKDQNVVLEQQKSEIELQSKKLEETNHILQQQRDEMQILNKTKDKFFSIIAHDLKNPIGALLNTTEILRNFTADISNETRADVYEMIAVSAKNTYALLENLLNWARTQTGNIKLESKIVSAQNLIEENLSLLKGSAKNKSICLFTDITEPLLVYVDANMIKTVIRNLITNAIKFTPESGTIKISGTKFDEYVQISVSDTGVGISDEVKEKLFKVGEHHSTEGTNNESGTGLGLVICKEFVEKNGGRLWVESEIGKGSSFIFTVPLGVGDIMVEDDIMELL